MRKQILLTLTAMTISAAAVSGCGNSSAKETESTTAAQTEENTADETSEADAGSQNDQVANPWTEADKDSLAAATGFEMTAPEEASDVTYSYMAEDGLAQMTYDLDGDSCVYRMQFADELTDISGLYYDWASEEDGTLSGLEAKYYSYGELNSTDTEHVQLVNWYDAVAGVTYSFSVSGSDLNGMDIQAYAESIYTPLQGESTDDPEGDQENELNTYFLGDHTRSDDGSTLSISENGDKTYDIHLTIVKLCDLEGGIGTFADHKMSFTIKDPNENEMSGVIYRDSDNRLTVKITDSTWDYLPTDELLEGFGESK